MASRFCDQPQQALVCQRKQRRPPYPQAARGVEVYNELDDEEDKEVSEFK
jgi:hypothetical protein